MENRGFVQRSPEALDSLVSYARALDIEISKVGQSTQVSQAGICDRRPRKVEPFEALHAAQVL